MASIEERVEKLIKNEIENLGYKLYDVQYAKEGKDYFLRVFIDKTDGTIDLNDCEKVSDLINPLLDNEDIIKEMYFLEVSSPGLNRTLFTNEHYTRFIGSEVLVKLNKAIEGTKTIKGILKENNETSITVEGTEEIIIPKDKIKSVNLEGEI